MDRGWKRIHGLRFRHTPGSNLSLFTDYTCCEICCVFTALLKMIQIFWAMQTGEDFPETLYTTGHSTIILALADIVFVTKTQCDQFITLSLQNSVFCLRYVCYNMTLALPTCFIPQGMSSRNRYQIILYKTKLTVLCEIYK